MPKPKTFAPEDVERVRALLKKAPEKPKAPSQLTAREMVAAISAEIRDLQKRNYTLDDIAVMIREGFNMETLGASTLRLYLQKKRKTQSAAQTPKKADTKK
jgi:hypothetical protein